MKSKLKSYTIIEMLISMLIISVVVVVTYALFSSLTRQLYMFTETEDSLLEYTYFKNALKRDVFECEKLKVKKEVVKLKYKDKEIRYVLGEGVVYREEGRIIDTFFVKAGVEKINPVFIKENGEKLTLSFVLDVDILKEKTHVFIKKDYGVDVLVNSFLGYEN
ncbi:PulJ/GspJ family protein [Tenacibaculum sp.]